MKLVEIFVQYINLGVEIPKETIISFFDLLQEVVLGRYAPVKSKLPTDWKNYLLDSKLFDYNKFKNVSSAMLFYLVQFFNREELIEKLKVVPIPIKFKKEIAAMIDWYPEELNVLQITENYFYYMYHCSIKNVAFEFNENVIFSLSDQPHMVQLMGIIFACAIQHNTINVLCHLKKIVEYFISSPLIRLMLTHSEKTP